MSNSSLPSQSGNRLLGRLPVEEFERVQSRLKPVSLELPRVLYETESPIDFAYFPTSAVLSAVTVMEDGNSIEVATIGNEGMVGLPFLLDAETAPHRVIVQVAGDGLRMSAADLKAQSREGTELLKLLTRYHLAFLRQSAQSVACNGLHQVQQRCCRWLLETHDRIESDVLPLTHEFLGVMLGVQRSSITEVLQPLQAKGLVRSQRGKITILDREGLEAAACECYGAVKRYFQKIMG